MKGPQYTKDRCRRGCRRSATGIASITPSSQKSVIVIELRDSALLPQKGLALTVKGHLG